jgi:uncharacterized protein (TIGR03083 family)
LVSGLSPDDAAKRAPACPEWSVHDVVAHLSGVCADVLAGNIEGVATDPWTAAQVETRRDWPLDKLLAEWTDVGPQVEAMAQFFPGRVGSQWVLDLHTHEHDIRHAIGAPGAKDSEGINVGVRFLVEVGVLSGVAVRGLPPLEIRAGDQQWVAGTGEPAATDDPAALDEAVTAAAGAVLMGGEPPVADVQPQAVLKVEPFELFRALTGRRSQDQIRAYDWSVDPEPYLPLFEFGPFTTRDEALAE